MTSLRHIDSNESFIYSHSHILKDELLHSGDSGGHHQQQHDVMMVDDDNGHENDNDSNNENELNSIIAENVNHRKSKRQSSVNAAKLIQTSFGTRSSRSKASHNDEQHGSTATQRKQQPRNIIHQQPKETKKVISYASPVVSSSSSSSSTTTNRKTVDTNHDMSSDTNHTMVDDENRKNKTTVMDMDDLISTDVCHTTMSTQTTRTAPNSEVNDQDEEMQQQETPTTPTVNTPSDSLPMVDVVDHGYEADIDYLSQKVSTPRSRRKTGVTNVPSPSASPMEKSMTVENRKRSRIEVESEINNVHQSKRRAATMANDDEPLNDELQTEEEQNIHNESVSSTGAENNPFSIDSDVEMPTPEKPEKIQRYYRADMAVIFGTKMILRASDLCFSNTAPLALQFQVHALNEPSLTIELSLDNIHNSWYCESESVCIGFQYHDMIRGIPYEWFDAGNDSSWITFLLNDDQSIQEQVLPQFKQLPDVCEKTHKKLEFMLQYSLSNSYKASINRILKKIQKGHEEEESNIQRTPESDSDMDVSGDYTEPITDEPVGRSRTRPSTRNQTLSLQFNMPTNKEILVYNKISLCVSDVGRLAQEQYLNDNIVDFWFKYLENEFAEYKSRFHIFNSQFYPLLLRDIERCVNRVEKDMQLFEKDLVFIPVCSDMHWRLVVICNPSQLLVEDYTDEPFLMYCDSLEGAMPRKLMERIRLYLTQKYILKHNERIPTLKAKDIKSKYAKLPIQQNSSDCGVYMLQYVEQIIRIYFEDMKIREAIKATKEQQQVTTEIPDSQEENEEGEEDEEEEEEHREPVLPIKNKHLFAADVVIQQRIRICDVILDMSLKQQCITEAELVNLKQSITSYNQQKADEEQASSGSDNDGEYTEAEKKSK